MNVHAHVVELPERRHGLEQEDHQAAALHRLDRARQDVRRDRLKVLQHEHAVGRAEDLVRLLVVAPADLRGRQEQLKRVVALRVQQAQLLLALDALHALHLVPGAR